jgi:hypothetical protein
MACRRCARLRARVEELGLDHEPRRAGRRLKERALVVGNDAAQQLERAPETGLDIEGRVEALRDVVERAGDRPDGVRSVREERTHRLRLFFPDGRRETGRPVRRDG